MVYLRSGWAIPFLAAACWAAPPVQYATYLGSAGSEKGWSVAADSSGNAYIGTNGSVLKLNAAGSAVAQTFAAPAGEVRGLAVDGGGYVAAAAGGTVERRTPAGALVFSVTLAGTVLAVATDGAGNVYCAGSVDVASKLKDVFVTRLAASDGHVLASVTFGGTNVDEALGIALDTGGNTYVTGRTYSTNFPVVGGLQAASGGAGLGDAFLTKIAANGTTLVYSTYMGWFEADSGRAVAVDASGAAYVTGSTGFIDVPRVNGFQTSRPGGFSDAFVAKVSPAGDAYVYLSYLGGADVDDAYGIAVDSSGRAVVIGETFSTDLPVSNAWQSVYGGTSTNGDAFLAKVSADGRTLEWASYLGGSGGDHGHSVAVDTAGCVYATGFTSSTNFPVTNALQPSFGGGAADAFALKACTKAAPRPDRIGVYENGVWYLDADGSGVWSAGDLAIAWGTAAMTPVSGDWNGDGKTEVGVYADGIWYLDADGNGIWSAGDKAFAWGYPGTSIPVLGDWNGDGKTKWGVYDRGLWFLDVNGNTFFDAGDSAFGWGDATFTPVVGDWNGDGRTKAGAFKAGAWYLDYNGSTIWDAGDKAFMWGPPTATPVPGDWNGDGRAKAGTFDTGAWLLDVDGSRTSTAGDKAFTWGGAGSRPVVGDWNGDGKSKVGVFTSGVWRLDSNGSCTWDTGDKEFPWGVAGDKLLVGKW